jgi:hypothetical protein
MEESDDRTLNVSAVFALLCCGVSLYLRHPYMAIFCFGTYLVLRPGKLPPAFEKRGRQIFLIIAALTVCLGIAVRTVMFAKCRSLWFDEALLAESIAARSWGELLAAPLSNAQSAPVLYVVAVKAACSILGYSEFSLRIFSLSAFLGLLACEWVLLKNVLKIDGVKTALVLTMTAFLPSFVYYSNELKPYMGDAFFAALTLLLFSFYTQNKLSLATLTVFYALILGFSSPAVFFVGGALAAEFLAAAFAKDKRRALYALISGLSIAAVFGLYYYWWLSPASEAMNDFWNKSPGKTKFDAFFILLVIMLYFAYTRNKLPLTALTVSYIVILGFCPPAVFFIGGIVAGEFSAAVFARANGGGGGGTGFRFFFPGGCPPLLLPYTAPG